MTSRRPNGSPPRPASCPPPRRYAHRALDNGTYAIDVISRAPPLEDQSQELVRELRDRDPDALVTGTTARYLDLEQSLGQHLPLMVSIVLAITIAVL
ncbi:MAG TPA: hypothetical protein VE487_07540, partial [Ilumatobacter sp.]|nr:hypothetical protein [Ilumatobacter sp.]